MYSMTGYGKAQYSGEIELSVEIKTVNNRYLDMNFKYPRTLNAFDDLMRKTVQGKLTRGRVDIFINFADKREGKREYECDEVLAKSYLAACKKLAEATKAEDDITLSTLIKVPDVIALKEEGENFEELSEIISGTLGEALDSLNEMRKAEGEKLKTDMFERLENIKGELKKIEERAPKVALNYREKLEKRMEEILSKTEVEESRILQEAALFADRCNIDEEITRLKSHISQFYLIAESEYAGKKLDFLIQEFNREANTICSKSNDVEVTNSALGLKCEIEKIREQVQNIE